MANDQHSGRYPWGEESLLSKMLKENANFKVTKIVETKEGLKVEAKKEYDVKSFLKLLEECIDYVKSCSIGELLCFYYKPGTFVTIDSILNGAKGCIEQLTTELDGATQYNNSLLERLNEYEKENEELTEKLKQLTLKNEEITQNSKSLFEVLTCRSNALKDKLNVSEKKNEELAEKLRLSNETVEERIKDLLRTRVENQYLKNRLKYEIGVAFDNDIKASEDENEELYREVKELREKLQRVTTENDHFKHQIDHMIAQHQALMERLKASDEEKAKLKKGSKAVSDVLDDVLKNAPARNCINCDRYDVCMTVAERKARKANNYKPCSLWKKADEK